MRSAKEDEADFRRCMARQRPRDLMSRVRGVTRGRVRQMPNWVLAMRLYGLGSTYAWRLCFEEGIDGDGFDSTPIVSAASGETARLTEAQLAALRWIATKRCTSSTMLGEDGVGGFRFSGPDGSLDVLPRDHATLCPFFEANPRVVEDQRDRLWRLTVAGWAAIAEPGGPAAEASA